jgi:hypothetical protein
MVTGKCPMIYIIFLPTLDFVGVETAFHIFFHNPDS